MESMLVAIAEVVEMNASELDKSEQGRDAKTAAGDKTPGSEQAGSDGVTHSNGSGRAGIGNRFVEPKPIDIPPKLYRIGEVIEYSGLSRQTVHNYTTMGLLVEVRRTDGGHRLYDESVFQRLNEIIALKAQHKSLAYIREYCTALDAE
ncbi:MAG: MerR family transcriptional regulator [Phycisphaerales bacterium]|nr:MerR family transcriptional regulator [Phycisphaerales bacterium]